MSINNLKIQCPSCEWKPDGGNYWRCNCGNVWNTFDTVGICPVCDKKWEKTQCPGTGYPGGCGLISNHDEWYTIPINYKKLFINKKNKENPKNIQPKANEYYTKKK